MPAADETFLAGLLQGPAELLPISSSAHVGLLLQWRHPTLQGAARKENEVALHAGTAMALAIARPPVRWRFLAAASLPPALAGLAFERFVEERLGTPGRWPPASWPAPSRWWPPTARRRDGRTPA